MSNQLQLNNITFEDLNIRMGGTKEKPLFCAKDVCRLLTVHTDSWRYLEENQRVRLISITNGGPQKMVFVTESGLYMLIMKSRKPEAIQFQNWVCDKVLPSIRKFGTYPPPDEVVRNDKRLYIKSEFDLQRAVVNFLDTYYWDCERDLLYNASLGELQDTPEKRIKSKLLGYKRGSPDLVIYDNTKAYTALVIEMKSPTGLGELSAAQHRILEKHRKRGAKVLIESYVY